MRHRVTRNLFRFLRAERGLESVEWVTVALIMAAIVLYFGRDLLVQLFDAFGEALASATTE